MKNSDRFVLYDSENKFEYTKIKSDIDIKIQSCSIYIFYFFYNFNYLFNSFNSSWFKKIWRSLNENQIKVLNNLKRADIIDRNGNFLARTVSSIDIGINPIEIIDNKKLMLNLKYIFPNKDYELVKSKFNKNKFFGLKKISDENYEK